MAKYKYGKKKFKPSHRDLRFKDYLIQLPVIPDQFGHEDLITESGDCLGNDSVGNCVIVAIWRMIMAWNKARGITINVSAQTAINTYSAITGYDPNNPDSDQGTDERDALTYALNTGFTDDDGNIHKIGGFANIDPKNLTHIDAATYLFESVLLGIECPDYLQDEFEAKKIWDVVPGYQIDGGHGVENIAKRINRILFTWGFPQPYNNDFATTFIDESWCVWSPEMFLNGKTLEGIDEQTLLNDQKMVQS